LEANLAYWNPTRFPRLHRIIFDNTLSQKEAIERVKDDAGRIDLVTGLSPLETLRVAQSAAAQVVKNRGSLTTVFGFFNLRKAGSPWHDLRLRQAVNYAINREDLLRYATKGNGEIIPALIPTRGYGYDPDLAPYAFDPSTARRLLQEAGHTAGLSLTLIASEELAAQATVVSKMLEQVGFQGNLQVLDPGAYNRKTDLSHLDQPAEQQAWDIALRSFFDRPNFPVLWFYHNFAVDGLNDWVSEEPELRQLYAQVLGSVDWEQQALIHQVERHSRDQAYFLFLYNPIGLYAVNKAVQLVPYVSPLLNLVETSVTEQHWSVRQQGAAVPE
jgi:peptide/nickel transport system substrate-binding protein